MARLDEYTDVVLDDQEKRQEIEALAYGEAWVDSGRLFAMEDGSPIHPGWLTDYFERLVELSGLPPIRLHDLRHVAASLMLAAGVDIKIVSETLGHSESRITRDIYQSVMPRAAREATAAMVPHAAPHAKAEAEFAEASADPRLDAVAQASIDLLVAKILEAAERDGRTVEELVRAAVSGLSGSGDNEPTERNGHTRATHEGAQIIAFRPRRVPA